MLLRPSLAQEIAKATPLRVMALGDSITAGVGARGSRAEDGGYRGHLAALLRQDGFHVTFVGDRTDYSRQIDDRAHDGWPGYVVRSFRSDPGPGELYGNLVRKALRENNPDVVLLMAGTNDLLRLSRGNRDYTLPEIVHSMDLLIGEIVEERPNIHLIVAPVVASPRVDECALTNFAGLTTCGPVNGESLRTVVDGYARRGYDVSLAANMVTAVPRDAAHFPDGIHPSGQQGYAEIATVWLQALERLTQAAHVQGDTAVLPH
jgi:lysophospholipase L1-like esterase